MKKDKIELILSEGYDNYKLNKFSEAISFFKKAYKIDNDYPKTLLLLGIANAELDNLNDARGYLYKAAISDPNNYYAQYNAAKVYSDLDRDEEAVKFHLNAIKIKPDSHEAWLNFGVTNKKIQKYELAIECFKKCLSTNPHSSESYINLGDIFFQNNKYKEAINNFNLSLKINQNNAEVITKIGVAYKNLQQLNKAIEFHKKALDIDPNNPSIYSNLGITYRGLYDLKKSIELLDKALELKPKFEPALINKAIAYADLGQYKIAEDLYNEVLKNNPKNIEASTNLGMLHLSYENFVKGWEYYETRWDQIKFQSYINTNKKKWDGKKIEENLLIVSEQGLGDQILYSSMINDTKKLCKKIYFTCDPKLVKLFENSFTNVEIISRDNFKENNPGEFFDYHIPLGSLGKYFRKKREDFISSPNPYLIDDNIKTKKIADKINKKDSLLCGISWKSNNDEIGINKSIKLEKLQKIIDFKNINFVNLQYGEVKQDLENFNKKSKNKIFEFDGIDVTDDIDSLASLIKNCDFVITTSNTTAHLAGALNIPTFVMVPRGKGKFHYWSSNKKSTPWYPSVIIFRQDQDFTWKNTVDELKKYIVDNFNLMS